MSSGAPSGIAGAPPPTARPDLGHECCSALREQAALLEQRLFDPVFATEPVGAATGLGLSITDGMIRDHEGSIEVDHRPGDGASPLRSLPLARTQQVDGATV